MLATPNRGPDGVAVFPLYRIALGFDFGRARIGVAVGEAVTGSARPVHTLPTCQQLHGRFNLPVSTIDERLSSWEAKRRYFEAASAGHRRGHNPTLDAQAAAVILESWFNQQRSPNPGVALSS